MNEPGPRPGVPQPGTPPTLALPSDHFVQNLGQLTRADVRYYHTSAGVRVGFSDGAVWYVAVGSRPTPVNVSPTAPSRTPRTLEGVALKLTFEGAALVAPVAEAQQPWVSNYFVGEPERWRSDVPSFGGLVYSGLYEGIDLTYEATDSGPKYHFEVAPGASPEDIRMRWEGADRVALGDAGQLVIETPVGFLEDAPPVAFDGTGHDVACHFALPAPNTVGFECEGWDGRTPLTIDPVVASTFLGGGEDEFVRDVATDPQGRAWIVGETSSLDFPTTPGAFATTFQLGEFDAFMACLSADAGALLSATYLGGSDGDSAFGVALGDDGDLYVTGLTTSPDFPFTAGAYQSTLARGQEEAFVVRLTPDGSALVYATALVGPEADGATRALAVDVDAAGVAYVAGATSAGAFPVTPGALAPRQGLGFAEAFLTAVASDGGSLVFSTFLDRGPGSTAWDVKTDGTRVYATGTAVHAATLFDAWVVALPKTGDALAFDVAVDGAGIDFAQGLALDPRGRIWVGGHTSSADFPTTPETAVDSTPNGQEDLFVLGLDATGAIVYGTYLGGADHDYGFAITVDDAGRVTVAGATTSANFPTAGDAAGSVYQGGRDAVIARLSPDGRTLEMATYLGGPGDETPMGLSVAPLGTVVAGNTMSAVLPADADAFQTEPGGSTDAFVALLSVPADQSSPPGPLVLTAPPDVEIACDVVPDPQVTGLATTSGGCGDAGVAWEDAVEPGVCTGDALISRRWTATDACGDSASAEQIIAVVDRVPPELTVPGDADLTCRDSGEPYETGEATASDACGGPVAVSWSDATQASACPLEPVTTRTWMAVDDCGNAASADQILSVHDLRPPSLLCPAPLTVPADSADGAAITVAPEIVVDDCDPNVAISTDAPALFPIGTTTVTITATDACGSSRSCTTNVTVMGQPLTVIDFEAWPAGTIMDDEIDGVAISAENANCRHPNLATVFDSAAPTGGDTDLATPGDGEGNTRAQGHLLIIAEKAVDSDGDGLIDDPDDEADGGRLVFAFAQPVDLARITLVDIEESGGSVALFQGNEEVFTGEIPASTDNSLQTFDLWQTPRQVDRLEVVLQGSGAVDDLVYCTGGSCLADSPPPGTTPLAPVEP